MSQKMGAMQRSVASLAVSLETAVRRAEVMTTDADGEPVPRYPDAAAEVARLTPLHAEALAALESAMAG